MPDYKKLQNGSDIRGVAIAVEGGKPVDLTEAAVRAIGGAFAGWLQSRLGEGAKRISIGRDSRLSGEQLCAWLRDGLSAAGMEVTDFGLCTTPAMFMSTVMEGWEFDGAVMITASHLPFERNGFKFFTAKGGLEKQDIAAILASAGAGDFPAGGAGACSRADFLPAYAELLQKKIRSATGMEQPLFGLRILVDAGNGAGGFFAGKVLAPLGADTTGSLFLTPDGRFPNHAPNPESAAAMDSIRAAVLEHKADFGIIFDTDVDRSSAVDASGREINRNAIVAMAAALIAKDFPGTTVVTDSITSDQLTEYLEKCLGLKHLRFKRGYKNVINKAKELNQNGVDSQLAIETSGHAAYKENYFLDDGAYLATKIVIKTAQLKKAGAGLDVVLSSLEEPKEAIEKRFSINRADFADYGQEILCRLEEWVEREGQQIGASLVSPNYEGVRINFDNEQVKGWCLLRKSLHDPKLPLNVEVTKGSCSDIVRVIDEFLADFDVS
mgnify:CR=1 FL=1